MRTDVPLDPESFFHEHELYNHIIQAYNYQPRCVSNRLLEQINIQYEN